MDVRVAGSALLTQAEKSFFVVFVFGVLDMVGFMAVAALGFFVGTGEFVPCPIVVETFFIKSDHLKISSVVFTMAIEAVFGAHLVGGVIAFPLLDSGIDGFVAFEALGISNTFTQFMAFGAVEHALQLGMRRR